METATQESEELLNDTDRTVVISVNPNSGSSDQRSIVEALAANLESQGFLVRMLSDIEEVKSTVAELVGQSEVKADSRSLSDSQADTRSGGLRAVVAAGGDGTVSLLANCLPPQTPLAILPLGTENLLAKHLGLTADPDAIAEMIVGGKTVRLDAGRANGNLFLVMASCGFDAEVVRQVHSERKGHIRHWTYVKPTIRAISQYRYPKLRIYTPDSAKPITAKWAFVFNVPRYAMNLPIVWDADPADGQLDLCTFRGGNLLRGLFYLAAICLRQHRGWRYSQYRQFKTIRIESDERVPYQLDGDPGGVLPLEIEVIPKFLRLMVPSGAKKMEP